MKLALISDIHGNFIALETILRHVRASGADGMAFLGDYASDFSGARCVMDILYAMRRDMPVWFVRGNRDDYLLDHRRGKTPFWSASSGSGALLFAYNALNQSDLDFLEGLPIAVGISAELTVCHATPMNNADKSAYYSRESAGECLRHAGTRFLVCGHMHQTRAQSFAEGQVHIISSAGIPVGAPGMTRFAYFTSDNGKSSIEHVTIPYDARCAVDEMELSGLTAMSHVWGRAVAANALTGRNACYDLVVTANKIVNALGLKYPAPESVYEQAARIIGLD